MDCFFQEEKLKFEELFGVVEIQKIENFLEVGNDMKVRDGDEYGCFKREVIFK